MRMLIQTAILTVDQLNKVSAEKNYLQLLRTLVTSDLCFTYMLFSKSTLEDIVAIGNGLLADSGDEGPNLLLEEQAEFVFHLETLQGYADSLRSRNPAGT
jgi:hypothetical protein